MNCGTMPQRYSVKRPTTKSTMQRTRIKSWPDRKDIVQRTSRFFKPVVKDGMKLTRSESPAARGPIINRTRSTSEITKGSIVKTTGKGSTSIGKVIIPRIRCRSGKDFVTKSKER